MTEVKRTTTPDGAAATPNVRREMSKSGRLPGDPVGDTPTRDSNAKPKTVVSQDNDKGKPKGVNKEVWEQARHNAESMGGLHGVDDEQRDRLIRIQYDKIAANDKQVHEWAGGSGILGDDGSK